MTDSDRLLETVYDVVNKQRNEGARLSVVRAALVAAQYRAAHIKDAGAARRPVDADGRRLQVAVVEDAPHAHAATTAAPISVD